MRTIEIDGKPVSIKLMSLRDVDMVKRDTAKLTNEGYDEDVAATIAEVMHGVSEAYFPLTVDGIYDLPAVHLIKLVEEIVGYNSPLEEQATPSAD